MCLFSVSYSSSHIPDSMLEESVVNHPSDTSAGIAALLAGFWLIYVLFVLGVIALGLIINWRIASKAGYSGAMSLLMLIPLVNIIILVIFAFSRWPIEDQRDALRLAAAAPNSPPAL
jgi:hypothetical protein